MNELISYRLIDVLATATEAVYLQLFMRTMTDKDIRFKKNVWMCLAYMVMTIIGTYAIPNPFVKAFIIIIGTGLIWVAGNKFSLAKGLGLAGLAFSWLSTAHGTAAYMSSFFLNSTMFQTDMAFMASWQYMVALELFAFSATFILFRVYKDFYFQWDTTDYILIGVIGGTATLISLKAISRLMMEGIAQRGDTIFSFLLFVGIFLLTIHFQKNSRLREQEEQVRLWAHELEGKIDYYQAKAAEELRVRKLYHDMKNMIIALKAEHGSSELLLPMEEELKGFDRFYETGNSILNVLLKEKIEKAQAENIDLQAAVELPNSDFIESRDLVILFGNALDNALEASRKLAVEERMITLKSGRMGNMLVITVENAMKDDVVDVTKTVKKDALLHGLGIKSMRDVALKYGGECVVDQGNQWFCLKVMIPIPLI